MFIADSQVHIWAANTPERPWVPGRHTHRPEPLGAGELLALMNGAGVARAVLVPPGLDGDRNDLVLAAAEAHPDRFVAMGRFDPLADGAPQRLAGWLQQRGMMGIRMSLTFPEIRTAMAEGRLDWFWRDAERHDVPLMLLATHAMAKDVDAIAARHPGLRIALCHLGLATGERDAAAFGTVDRILPLAKRPNIAVKVSALPAYTSDAYPYRALHDCLRKVGEAFGAARMFWGTDVSRLPCPYTEAITMFTEEMPWLATADKEWIMGRALCEWLRWPIPSKREGTP